MAALFANLLDPVLAVCFMKARAIAAPSEMTAMLVGGGVPHERPAVAATKRLDVRANFRHYVAIAMIDPRRASHAINMQLPK